MGKDELSEIALSESHLRLEGSTLHVPSLASIVDLINPSASAAVLLAEYNRTGNMADLQSISMKLQKTSSLDLNMVLGNIEGTFQWGFKDFSKSARNVRLDGTVLRADLRTSKGEWKADSFELHGKIDRHDGVLCAKEVPVVLAIRKDAQQQFEAQLEQYLLANPNLKLAALNHPNGQTSFVAIANDNGTGEVAFNNHPDWDTDPKIGYYEVRTTLDGMDVDSTFKTLTAEAKAAVFHVADRTGHPITQAELNFLSASASAGVGGMYGGDGVPLYFGAEAKINLFDVKASLIDANLGLGVDTGIGLKDYSLEAELLGCGVTIGKKTSISVFGTSIGLDFGRLFG